MKIHIYFLSAAIVALLDQTTKHLVRTFIEPFETIRVLPFLNIINIRNEGAAFGMFRGLGNTMFIVISVVAIIFVIYLILRGNEDKPGLSLILGGAAGNLLDRIFFGSVIDFIDVFAGRFHWPAFNVADSALTIGIVVMLIRSFSDLFRKVNTGVSGIN